jgi:hypothetical protein
VADPPGPIDNTELEKWLSTKNDQVDEDTERYYTVSKNLFYFFISLYGGGPAIVHRKHYFLHEVRED